MRLLTCGCTVETMGNNVQALWCFSLSAGWCLAGQEVIDFNNRKTPLFVTTIHLDQCTISNTSRSTDGFTPEVTVQHAPPTGHFDLSQQTKHRCFHDNVIFSSLFICVTSSPCLFCPPACDPEIDHSTPSSQRSLTERKRRLSEARVSKDVQMYLVEAF